MVLDWVELDGRIGQVAKPGLVNRGVRGADSGYVGRRWVDGVVTHKVITLLIHSDAKLKTELED